LSTIGSFDTKSQLCMALLKQKVYALTADFSIAFQ